jgi:alpha-beta hydrolase superfamily lysophospholipase
LRDWRNRIRLTIACLLAGILLNACSTRETASTSAAAPSTSDARLASLAELSLSSLKLRSYRSRIAPLGNLFPPGAKPGHRFVGTYDSDGLRVYTRIDVPASPPPVSGYPVLIFVHGWYGREAAPAFDFMREPGSVYARYIDAFTNAGYLVLSPALRGHGTVNGIAADGIEYLEAWDNSTYVSPLFYAVDVLNLLEGVDSLESVDWKVWGLDHGVRVDSERISITGHSQGGDVALTALAVSGEGALLRHELKTGSLWSGCFGPRLEQARIYAPMASTLEAFMSGDGTWTGTAIGHDGRVNPNFIFGWPSDWIVTVDISSSEWSWQADTWSEPTVEAVLRKRTAAMYGAFKEQVGDLTNARWRLDTSSNGRVSIRHDPAVVNAMQALDAFRHPELLTETIYFHHSDQDYYSPPRWNADLSSRINVSGGHARAFLYPRNTHPLMVSPYEWFSPGEVVEGLPYAIHRDLALFGTNDIEEALRVSEDRLSIDALRRYAATVKNEFRTEFQRPPLGDISRRVVSFSADGLKEYALILQPKGPPPPSGWPVVLLNHGYHPEPPNYGRVADGSTDRPGDYYRGLPLAFARAGFLVVVPDYRGHNDSEGREYTLSPIASLWYARDVIAAFKAIGSLNGANPSRVFLWGHSMGGAVTLRALLALGGRVTAASIWSASTTDLEALAANTDRRKAAQKPGSRSALNEIKDSIAALPFHFSLDAANASASFADLETPLNIHHSMDDPVVPYNWSETTYQELDRLRKPVWLYPYPSAEHLFRDGDSDLALQRDLALFRESSNE